MHRFKTGFRNKGKAPKDDSGLSTVNEKEETYPGAAIVSISDGTFQLE